VLAAGEKKKRKKNKKRRKNWRRTKETGEADVLFDR
jgi:hypothetical protein